ncbi:hypothetical protein Pmar_PMAR008229 [Perkinsus marinus ATCC 50983]|uniref:Uncharacterized protein n=1 Tax=Perkinsus marinus (strain ATCC 50983 / TXsc) TaxID=423536 RepID=C5LNM9_PERM5|nr:hypothetical protein Pmar_PMAR008229 [Perkinsus marinus ATCC 50983]EER01648.1 hypothetical protein Pmar_PMAR008229 [Perkinsus marinus ATCC 50983]|eukprot:XP_002768930.1 hypothetical protein Pmar_PMAR008229 [Perkinsus marinus ATCC 50983]
MLLVIDLSLQQLHIVAEVCNRKLANDGADVMAHALKYFRGLIHERSTRGRFMQEWTPLHVCCLKGKVSAAQLLLKAGAKPSMRTGPVCIHSAILNDIASGRVRVGKIDPDRDADDGALPRNRGFPLLHLDMVDEGLLPIHLAALGGHFKTAMLLLKQYGGDPSSASLKHQWTVLHFAVWGGNLNLVQELCRLTNRKYNVFSRSGLIRQRVSAAQTSLLVDFLVLWTIEFGKPSDTTAQSFSNSEFLLKQLARMVKVGEPSSVRPKVA